ncbi:MAG: LON peptidase substrate-binding domain-containing protein [Candidatus Nanopelagicales bacterium]
MPTVPLFPLQTVLVPGLVLPLHIFEPRYRLMIRTLADSPEEDRGFGVVAIRPGSDPENEGLSALYPVGTMARIMDVDPLPDGRFDVVTVGARRFSILSLVPGLPYLRADVRLHGEPVGDPRRAAVLARAATALLGQYRSLIAAWGVIELAEIEDLPKDPVVLSHLVSSAIVTDLTERQRLLGITDAEGRLAAACAVLRREIALMSALPSMPAVDLAAARPCNN